MKLNLKEETRYEHIINKYIFLHKYHHHNFTVETCTQ